MAAAAPAMAAPSGGASDFQPSRNRFAPPNAGRASRMGSESASLTDEEAWIAVIGGSGKHHYLSSFERLADGESGGWNWAAFFLRWYWMLYRKMWLAAFLWYIAPTFVMVAVVLVCALVAKSAMPVAAIACVVGYVLLPGMKGNAWYYQHCQAKIRAVRARGGSREQMLARLEAAGGTSSIIVIILALFGILAGLGILAAISLPAYQQYTVKAKVAEAIPLGTEVADAVGRQYEQTGTLPSQSDVDAIVLRAAHRSRSVSSVDLDSTTGTLTLKLAAAPRDGAIQFVPNSDNNRHLSWTCTASADMQRFVPASCRSEATPTR